MRHFRSGKRNVEYLELKRVEEWSNKLGFQWLISHKTSPVSAMEVEMGEMPLRIKRVN